MNPPRIDNIPGAQDDLAPTNDMLDLLPAPAGSARVLKITTPYMRGADVLAYQRLINVYLGLWHVSHRVDEDSQFGPDTWDTGFCICFGMGVNSHKYAWGVTDAAVAILVNPGLRNSYEYRDANNRAHDGYRVRLQHRWDKHGPDLAIEFAKTKIGIKESPPGSNTGPQIDDWERACGFYAGPWCGAFANACLHAAGLPNQDWMAYCPYIEAHARSGVMGWSWHSIGDGQAGDLVLYEEGGVAGHVGLHIFDGWTIEGNTSKGDGSPNNGGEVCRIHRDWRDPSFPVRGLARPPYTR